MLGLVSRQNWSGTILILSWLIVLISTLTVATIRGGTLIDCVRKIAAPFSCSCSLASHTLLLPIVRALVPSFVHCTPALLVLAKSMPKIRCLFKCSQTKNSCSISLWFNRSLHLVLPTTPRLEPEALTTLGSPVSIRVGLSNLFYISTDITLRVAPVSKRVLILCFPICVTNTVPCWLPIVSSM